MQTAFDTAAAVNRPLRRPGAGLAGGSAARRLEAAGADSLEDLREAQRLRFPDFGTADLPMLMTLGGLPRRHRRPFLGQADD